MEEQQSVCESEDEEPYITEEKIMATIFTECDTEGTGKVPVLKLIYFMSSKADQNLDRSLLEDLRLMLDPQGSNVDVTRQTFDAAMRIWAQKVKNNNNISCTEGPDSCHNGNTDSTHILCDDEASPSSDSTQYLAYDLHNSSNISSFSCGDDEAVAFPLTVDMNSLLESVMELKHSKKQLEEQNKDLQSQLHTSEDSYALLQRDYKNICCKVASLQAATEQCHQLQEECEELKETAVTAEATSIVLKLRVQQLEKEVQVHKQQLLELENQKMELMLELVMSKKKNQEMQEIDKVQKIEIEQLLKQCIQHENLHSQQSGHILELEGRINDLLSTIQYLQEEKRSVEVCLLSMEDELLSIHSQSPLSIIKKGSVVGNKSITSSEDDSYVSAHSLPFRFLIDNHSSLLAEFEAVKMAPGSSTETLTWGSVNLQSLQKPHEMELEWECQNLKIDFLHDQYKKTLPELTMLKELQQNHSATSNTSLSRPTSAGDMGHLMQSIITQTDPDILMHLEEEPCHRKKRMLSSVTIFEETSVPESDFLLLDVQNCTLPQSDTELAKWVRDTDALLAERRKTNLQARAGDVCDGLGMEHREPSEADMTLALCPVLKRASSVTSTPEEQETTSMRRCMSESQVVGSGGCGSSVSSEASSSSTPPPDVFPSLSDVVLQQLGLNATVATRPSEVLSEQDIENRFSALSLAFKTDKLTLGTRQERQQRQRDQAERNMAAEVTKLKAAVHNLNYLCKDSESIEILAKIQDQVDVLQQSTELVSSSAEIFGAVQQESRVSKAIEVMLSHVENLKRMYEKEHAELEETKRVLLENNLIVEGSMDITEVGQRNPRHRILSPLSGQGKQRRRASIAVFRPLASPDSTRTSNTSLTFGDTKRGAAHSRRTSSSHMESSSPAWDRTDRLERPEILGGSMDDIKELAEGRHESSVDLEEQNATLEENNNCTGTASHKSSRCNSPLEVGGENFTSDLGNIDKSHMQIGERKEDCTKDSNCSPPSLMRNLHSLRSFRDSTMEFICQMYMTLVDCMMPLNMDYIFIQMRRCATLLLLFAALWSLVFTFVPTTAQSWNSVPFSWLTLKDILIPYTELRHYGPPPT